MQSDEIRQKNIWVQAIYHYIKLYKTLIDQIYQ